MLNENGQNEGISSDLRIVNGQLSIWLNMYMQFHLSNGLASFILASNFVSEKKEEWLLIELPSLAGVIFFQIQISLKLLIKFHAARVSFFSPEICWNWKFSIWAVFSADRAYPGFMDFFQALYQPWKKLSVSLCESLFKAHFHRQLEPQHWIFNIDNSLQCWSEMSMLSW